MGNIVLLDELTINQIAAGEVIERPASVIKEMVENSIDAGATNITVEIKNGGISYIRISDNGKGIARDDVEMAFERHATSKIRSANDLGSVKSMGFRGEALASIASIATVELVTKTEEESIGTKIVVEGGEVLLVEDEGCTKGTSITVRNLFFNTPVRYKFLKKDFTESGYIEDVMTRIALVHPEIAIRLINTNKTVLQTNGSGNIKDVIYSIYGKQITEEVLEVSYEYDYIKINGVIGKPAIARSNRSNQIFFVNKRYVKDKVLTAASEQAFKGLIPIGKFGFMILNLEMNPTKVDVNVHPAKLEVRFENEDVVFKAMYHAIKDTLLRANLISDREKNKEIQNNSKDAFKIQSNFARGLGGLFKKKEENKSLEDAEKNKLIENEDIPKIFRKNNEDDNVVRENKIEINENKKENERNTQENEKIELIKDNENNENNEKMDLKNETSDSSEKGENSENIVENEQEKFLSDEIFTQEEKSENSEDKKEKMIPIVFENEENISNNFEITENDGVHSKNDEENENLEEKKEQTISQTQEDSKKEEKNSEQLSDENLKIEEEHESSIDNIENNNSKTNAEISNHTNETTYEVSNNTEVPKEKTLQEKLEDELSFKEMYRKLFGKEPYGGRVREEVQDEQIKENKVQENFYKIDEEASASNISLFEEIEEYNKPTYKFIGIAFNTYIILEIANELYIMDQHAAHERIMYEKIKKNFYSGNNNNSQLLLLPDIITLTHKEMGIAKDNFQMFERAGFILEEFGENTIKLSGVPDICVDLETKELFMETLDEINTVARTAKQEKEEKFIATVACKAAVKANMGLSKEEVDSLMTELLKLPNPFSCPHGRPTVIKMSKYDIERKFERK